MDVLDQVMKSSLSNTLLRNTYLCVEIHQFQSWSLVITLHQPKERRMRPLTLNITNFYAWKLGTQWQTPCSQELPVRLIRVILRWTKASLLMLGLDAPKECSPSPFPHADRIPCPRVPDQISSIGCDVSSRCRRVSRDDAQHSTQTLPGRKVVSRASRYIEHRGLPTPWGLLCAPFYLIVVNKAR